MEEPLELMQRGKGRERSTDSSAAEKHFIERKIKAGDTLNSIALHYSVSDLKRMNGLLNDQDFVARSSIKIPMSKLRHALRLGMESDTEEESDERIEVDENERLIDSPDSSVDHLFSKTDATIAQVRESLGEDAPASFHFLDATAPKPTHTPIWLLLFAVLFVFVVLPLFITIYEEKADEDERPNHTHYHNGIPHHTN